MMNLLHWRLLVAVADAGSVSKAAERYGITQSGASQAITQMEESLGIKVFVRERRQTSVTAVGQQVLDRARQMLAELESIQNLADSAKEWDKGRITLASFPSVFALMLRPLISSFSRIHPGIEVVHLNGTDKEVEEWLANESIDLGVVMNPAPHRQAIPLGRDAWVVVMPSAHPLARRSSSKGVALHELVDEPFIAATGGCHLHGQEIASQHGVDLKNVRISVQDWDTAYSLIREGMGLSVVPFSTVPDDIRGIRVMELAESVYREFGLVLAASNHKSLPVTALLDHIQNVADTLSRKP
ncbi:LysR family transcriptional regulator [Litchfieldella qijiaojingensis]|uniref:LysR family transcriptional regulator n=1 Tax=Litchfieldella qijiaojingensis TaxID=980347 RepID=A0ABQ2Z8J4_9GAMM|nr:LysR family transcriptional regulator [Halomonas qijiaojingensis]GGY05247.1 LysR family transcriptional regulator [Halomonas qijiaojingensis]